jgi:hypothetical protein
LQLIDRAWQIRRRLLEPRGAAFLVCGLNMTKRATTAIERAAETARGREGPPSGSVRLGMILGAAVTIALVVLSVIRAPALTIRSPATQRSLAGAIGIAVLYGTIGWYAPDRRGLRDPRVLGPGVSCGLVSGGVFAISMLCEYLVPHDERQNVILALSTFGIFLGLLLGAGFVATLKTHRLASSPLAAVWAGLIASQLWFILLLSIYHAFQGTPQEARFLEVDQVIADFRRSGAADLRTFIFEDYMGGGFFHSLLGPLMAVPLGSLGGLGAKLWLASTGRTGR